MLNLHFCTANNTEFMLAHKVVNLSYATCAAVFQRNNAVRAKELHLLLELLNPQGGSLFDSTHPTNYLKVQGHLPEDREKMLKELESQW